MGTGPTVCECVTVHFGDCIKLRKNRYDDKVITDAQKLTSTKFSLQHKLNKKLTTKLISFKNENQSSHL